MSAMSYTEGGPGPWSRPHHHHHHDAGPEGCRPGGREARRLIHRMLGGRPTPEDLHRLEELIASRVMHHGPFGGPGPFGRGPRGRGRGRGRARRGDVRLALLRLLAEEPRNGYGLMQTIQERSGGRWRPSPGSVYPTLAQLEDEGLITSGDTGSGRQFEITDAGREHLAARAEEPDPWQLDDDGAESPMSELGPLVFAIGQAVWQVSSVGDDSQRARAIELLQETRRALYRILAEDEDENEPGGPESADSEA